MCLFKRNQVWIFAAYVDDWSQKMQYFFSLFILFFILYPSAFIHLYQAPIFGPNQNSVYSTRVCVDYLKIKKHFLLLIRFWRQVSYWMNQASHFTLPCNNLETPVKHHKHPWNRFETFLKPSWQSLENPLTPLKQPWVTLKTPFKHPWNSNKSLPLKLHRNFL